MLRTIDITEYDNENSDKVNLILSEAEFLNPISTFKQILEGETRFFCNYTQIKLTENQHNKFVQYLRGKEKLFLDDFGSIDSASYLLAFSFGEGPEVNLKLAKNILKILGDNTLSCVLYLQWEIAKEFETIRRKNRHYNVIPIRLDDDQKYMTTIDVIDKFFSSSSLSENDNVFIVCQSWHGLSVMNGCKNRNMSICGGGFVNDFATNDRQSWVRDPFSWVLKESTKIKN